MRIDHVVLSVADLDRAAERLAAVGLVSVQGGIHPSWGTANRIVPLGTDYLELLAVVDEAAGERTTLGSQLLRLTADGADRWFAVCLADDDIAATAARLGLEVTPGSRVRPDGVRVAWRGAGIEAPSRPFGFPFFIDWELEPGDHPGAAGVQQPSGARGIAWVEIGADPVAFDDWTGDAGVPVRLVEGEPGVRRVALATPGGELILEG
jgi:catechol 2,3-dioxygenase-like lactoylglutathione lyase family enzyme